MRTTLAVAFACTALAGTVLVRAADRTPTASSTPQSKPTVQPSTGSAVNAEKFDKPKYDTSKLQLNDSCPPTDTHSECRNGMQWICRPYSTHFGTCKSRERCSSTGHAC